MATSFVDGFKEILTGASDAYGNVLRAQAEAAATRIQAYGGHGGGQYGNNANGDPEYPPGSMGSTTIPSWVLMAAAAGLVFVLVRR